MEAGFYVCLQVDLLRLAQKKELVSVPPEDGDRIQSLNKLVLN
jgi:hypothetical protein